MGGVQEKSEYRYSERQMSRLIEAGDKVSVHFNAGGFGGGACSLYGEVVSVPADSGDMWYIKDRDNDTVHAINPASSTLVQIILREKVEK